jgi:DHA2 family multidrug resistance protein
VLTPLWMQTQLGYTATWAGLAAAPGGIVAVFISPLVGRNLGRTDARWIATIAFIAFAVSYYMRSKLTTASAFIDFVIPQMVFGIALGTFFVAILAITFDGIPQPRVPAASGLAVFLRTLAGSFATSITTTFWDRREAWHQAHLAAASSIYDPTAQVALARLEASGMSEPAALAVLNRELVGQSYLLSSIDYFWNSAIASVLLIAFVWFTKPSGRGGGAPVAAD